MSNQQLFQKLQALPESNITVKTLNVLDAIVSGKWQNITNFEQMIRDETGETDLDYLQEIGEHALKLYDDASNGYQRAMKIFELVDDVDRIAGAASLANQASKKFSFLNFLDRITPDDELTQSIDAGVKFVAELAAFTSLHGIPGDSVSDFVGSLGNAAHADRMRLTAWLMIDGVLPLGPDFISKISDKIQGAGENTLTSNPLFTKISSFLPGTSIADKKGLILQSLSGAKGWANSLVSKNGLTRDLIFDKVRKYVDVGDKGMDVVAAGLDMTTNYFEHTGTQTVAREVIKRAYGEV